MVFFRKILVLIYCCPLFLCSATVAQAISFSDDFSADTTSEYTVIDTWTGGGLGQFLYDAAGQRIQVLTGDNIGLQFSYDYLPLLDQGSFSIDFLPTQKYPDGGYIVLVLRQDANNYFELFNSDGYGAGLISKFVSGVMVDQAFFTNEYSQNNTYQITIYFSPEQTTVNAFGEVITINTDTSSISVNSFEIDTVQQDAYYDNIYYQSSDDTTPPVWDSIVGIASATDTTTGGGVTIEFDNATDGVDGSNVEYNVYYAETSLWDGADWTNNSVFLDVTPAVGTTYTNAFTVTGLTDDVSYTFGVRVEDQSGNEDTNTNTAAATPTLVAPDTTPPVWDSIVGIASATDTTTGGGVTIEFDNATDGVDGSNVEYNVYYAETSLWDGADWTNNSVFLDVTPAVGTTYTNAFTVTGLTDDVSYTFGVRVEDQSGNEDTNTNTAAATPTGPAAAFSDDFSADTTSEYTVIDTWTGGGLGQFLYDAAGQRIQVLTGDNIGLQFSYDYLPLLDQGSFSIDFLPTQKYPDGGYIVLVLRQDANNYFELFNSDGYGAGLISKFVSGVMVDQAFFTNEYSQNNTYQITIYFSPEQTTVNAFGEVITINTDTSSISVNSFEIDTVQQDAYYDNIYYQSSDDTTPPVWDSIVGIASATDTTTGGGVTIEFDNATDGVDGSNVEYNVYYAETSLWDGADWTNNSVFLDVTPAVGTTYTNAFTVTGLTDDVSYTFGVRVEDQSGNEDTNTNTAAATPTLVAPDTTPPVWDSIVGIASATDTTTGGGVTIEFDNATDGVDGSNVEYNVYYAETSLWDGADWTNNSVFLDVTPAVGTTYTNAFTVTGLTDDVSYTFGVRVEDQSGNEDTNTNTAAATPTLVAPDTTPPVWDSIVGIASATDTTTGGGVTIEFDNATDGVDGSNVEYNVYYAETSLWDGADWTNNSVFLDVSPAVGTTYTNAFTVTGLTDDISYTFGVRVEDQNGNEDTNTNTAAATPTGPAAAFSDDFSADTTSEYTVIDTWTGGGLGQFLYDAAGQRIQVLTGDNIGLQFSYDYLPLLDQGSFSIDFLPTQKYPDGGYIVLVLRQDANNYFELFNSDGYGAGLISKFVSGVMVDQAFFTNEYSQNNTYQITIYFSPEQTTVNAFGEVITINTDTSSISVNSFEIDTVQQDAYYDNVFYAIGEPYIFIAEPVSSYLQVSNDLFVEALAGNLDLGWGIKLVLDDGTLSEEIVIDKTNPYTGTFFNVLLGEHTIDAFVIDENNNEVSGSSTWDTEFPIGIGDYYVAIGDSITYGLSDDVPSDDISADGRNSGGGYEPILNDLLTSAPPDGFGYPHTIINEGVLGDTSACGRNLISAIISNHPNALRFLVQYGTNDSDMFFPVPTGRGLDSDDPDYPGTFKDNMQHIIDAINTADKEVCLAKIPIALSGCSTCPPYTDPSLGQKNLLWIKEYNYVIDELISDPLNNITIVPPNFYSYFELNYASEYADWLHPNGIGYNSMAELWHDSLCSTCIPLH